MSVVYRLCILSVREDDAAVLVFLECYTHIAIIHERERYKKSKTSLDEHDHVNVAGSRDFSTNPCLGKPQFSSGGEHRSTSGMILLSVIHELAVSANMHGTHPLTQ